DETAPGAGVPDAVVPTDPAAAPAPASDVSSDGVPAVVPADGVPAVVPADGVPSEAELERIATPATVRRAPRYRAFMVTGALVGAVVALVVALATAGSSGVTSDDGGVLPFLGGQNGVRWLLALTGAVVGCFVGGGVAAYVDRRSARRSQRSARP
ncbi:hypothetical protein, partial [Cellulomonas sp. B6]|uniref:hypothetical protein n=1 Tax=Cellulomonas sp. B6 TaxID=1295626 RepID=UPI000ABB6BBB